MDKSKNNLGEKLLILFAFLVILITCLYPLFVYQEAGLGYDTGFYKRYLEIESNTLLNPSTVILGEGSWGTKLILSLLARLDIGSSFVLFGSYILSVLLLGLAIYLLTFELFKNKKTAIFALWIFALSSVQWLAYGFMFYKQFFAISLLLLAFYFLEKKSLYFVPLLFFSLISHRTTFFLASAALVVYALVGFFRTKIKKSIHLLLIIMVVLITTWLNWPTVINLLSVLQKGFPDHDPYHLRTGLFIDMATFFRLTFPYILFSILGLWILIKKRSISLFFFFSLTTALLVLFKSYFYQRILFYLDLSLIILAAGAIGYIFENIKKSKIMNLLIILLFLLMAANLFFTINSYQPQITQSAIDEISLLRQAEDEAYVMTYSSDFTPWLYGWAGPDKRIISPGMLWDRWNFEQWNEFWTANLEKQKKMLAEYQAPLYIFKPPVEYQSDKCFEKFSDLILKFTCY